MLCPQALFHRAPFFPSPRRGVCAGRRVSRAAAQLLSQQLRLDCRSHRRNPADAPFERLRGRVFNRIHGYQKRFFSGRSEGFFRVYGEKILRQELRLAHLFRRRRARFSSQDGEAPFPGCSRNLLRREQHFAVRTGGLSAHHRSVRERRYLGYRRACPSPFPPHQRSCARERSLHHGNDGDQPGAERTGVFGGSRPNPRSLRILGGRAPGCALRASPRDSAAHAGVLSG